MDRTAILLPPSAIDRQHNACAQLRGLLAREHTPPLALVETYGELTGEDQYTDENELALVGQMVDESRVVVETGRVRMNLFLAF